MKFFGLFVRWILKIKMTSEIPKKRLPVVVVLGATGTGKSKLAVDLAAKFNGEVISADSMQVYKGLDILTNKVTEEEMNGVPHHMISIVDHSKKFDVTNFRNMALPIVESLLSQNKIPFIVGGTNYYIESLLWKILIDKPSSDSEPQSKRIKLADDKVIDQKSKEIMDFLVGHSKDFDHDLMLPWSNLEVYRALQAVDPDRAKKLHPNDRRKVIRSLQVFIQTGRAHSELIEEQLKSTQDVRPGQETPSGSKVGGPLRFENTICLWIQAPNEILEDRIYRRVDKMIESGLRRELEDFMDILGSESALLFTQGILQSIGFKEFEEYLLLPPEKRHTEEGEKIFNEGVKKLKLVTKQYARKQLKWIRQRFLRPSRRIVPPVFKLDGSSTAHPDWEANVTSVAHEILQSYINANDDHPLVQDRLVPPEKEVEDDMIARTCEVCDRVMLGMVQWETHLKSYRHRKMLKRKKQKEDELQNSNVQASDSS